VEHKGGIEVHTSDRILFKRCRRKWDLSSPIRNNLAPNSGAIAPLWFGTGFHFAMEDIHGYHKYDSGADAFRVYASLFRGDERPSEFDELVEMGVAMLDYYENLWLPRRNEFRTVFVGDKPQVEVTFAIPIPGVVDRSTGEVRDDVFYTGTFDRVVSDPYGRYWVVDYKTAQRFDTNKLDTDPQITAYTWAASQLYGVAFEGVLYMQFLKTIPGSPKILKNGEFSQAKNQGTTYALYTQALKEIHGKIPYEYVDFVNYLASTESPDGDPLIRRDLVRRNEAFQEAELAKIIAEANDMLDPMLQLYPNPTRDCMWDCPFRVPCISMDDGSDWKLQLEEGFVKKGARDGWKRKLEGAGVTLDPDAEGESFAFLEGIHAGNA
jgi:hypothetical protein